MSNKFLPKNVFENPDEYLEFMTAPNDRDYEGQHFDRKEACRPSNAGSVTRNDLSKLTENVIETLSAFANSNKEGGLLVLGIGSDGSVAGLAHLNDQQFTSLGQMRSGLIHPNTSFKIHKISVQGTTAEIALIYVPYASNFICETLANPKRAWRRDGSQNMELSERELTVIKRDKKVLDYEATHCSRYSDEEIDNGVLKEFSAGFLNSSSYQWSTEEILKHTGAVLADSSDHWLTNAGALFFNVNPQRYISQAFIRLLRFDVPLDERDRRPSPTFDKNFTGSITKQIRDLRTFIKDSAFFETYQRRRDAGGFIEEPEFPLIAVDEAIVNAVVHRDYAITKPILCEKYLDAFVVISPGGIIQNQSIPEHFTLENTRLEHLSRNPKLTSWLCQTKDTQGRSFVQALQEGTRRMHEEMNTLGLPAPDYETTIFETKVVLRNNAAQRKEVRLHSTEETPEFTNLFPLTGVARLDDLEQNRQQRINILTALKNKLSANGWFIDKNSFGNLIAHRKGASVESSSAAAGIVKLYPSYVFQLRDFFGKIYLLLDYTVIVQSVLKMTDAIDAFGKEKLVDLRCVAHLQTWVQGRIVGFGDDYCLVHCFDSKAEERMPFNKVIPRLPQRFIDELLQKKKIQYDLSKEIRRAQFGFDNNASHRRFENIKALVDDLLRDIFPLDVFSRSISISPVPLHLSPQGGGKSLLRIEALQEPQVEFAKHNSTADVREGITAFGSYDNEPKNIEIVPFCGGAYARQMEDLIQRLRAGKFKFKGTERTFGVKMTYNTVINANPEELESAVTRILDQHPEWIGDNLLSRLFLVHCPNNNQAFDDENAPYYRVKRLLLEKGIPCQMVNTPTLENADWKDLNLALNIVAKCGQTPWVLPESIPDCDFFVGLSYTQNSSGPQSRLMAFANVFNQYGRWEFYSGGSEVFPYEEKTKFYERLVKDTLNNLNLSDTPTICFHYSAKFSREDREAILRAARSLRPQGTYVFVWINSHHNVRLYDSRAETNGSVARGKYVVGTPNQIYLSTTGHNPYRKSLGTPQPLELNVHIEPYRKADLKVLASQILSLTKLNWASTDSLCAEPITIKYAGDIAYLTAAFLRQGEGFKLHPCLTKTPWFI